MSGMNRNVVLLLAFVFISLQTKAHDIEVVNSEGTTIYYNFINDKTALSVTFKGDYPYQSGAQYKGDITIPNTVEYRGNVYEVTEIGASAFINCSNLNSVKINEGVTAICEDAFLACYKLSAITLPASLKRIDKDAFASCSGLEKVIIGNIAAWCAINLDGFKSNPLFYAKKIFSDNNTEIIDLVIPEGVNNILQYTFYNCSNIRSVMLPQSLKKIANYSFTDCSNLQSIDFSENLESIGDYAFKGCKVASLTIPCLIGEGAFIDCNYLKKLTINSNFISSTSAEKSLKTIFGTQVNECVIGNKVLKIGDYAFDGFENLTSVTISENVADIGEKSFDGCTNLAKVIILSNALVSKDYNATLNAWDVTDPVHPKELWSNITGFTTIFGQYVEYELGENITKIGRYAFAFSNMQSISLPTSISEIGAGAFLNCTKLLSISIPTQITSIAYDTFRGCRSLTSIEINNRITEIGNEAFRNCSSLNSITIPNSVKSIGYYAFAGCVNVKQVTIGNGVTMIDKKSFFDSEKSTEPECISNIESVTVNSTPVLKNKIVELFGNNIKEFTIGESVTSIGKNAFQGCAELEKVSIESNPIVSSGHLIDIFGEQVKEYVIGENVTSIGESAFSGGTGITKIILPNSVQTIGDKAFYGCIGITSISIPTSLNAVGGWAFDGCVGLASVILEDQAAWSRISFTHDSSNPLSYSHHLFKKDGTEITEYRFPEGLTEIGNFVLYGGSNIISVSIPNSVKRIGWFSFSGCSKLTSIILPNEISAIKSYAFYGCSSLSAINLPDNILEIGDDAFNGCSSITSVTFPKSLSIISPRLFSGCTSLKSVVIPINTKKIYNDAFKGCKKLTSVTVEWNEPISIDYFTFENRKNATLYIPLGSSQNYKKANYWNEFGNIVEIDKSTISFADAAVKAICVSNWDTNGDGELDKEEAAAVKDIGAIFKQNATITSFDELMYFSGLTSINESAFYKCSKLSSIIIPNNVTTIGSQAFGACTSLALITIPQGVNSIGLSAFGTCSSLKTISIPEGVSEIAEYTFSQCLNLEEASLPNSLRTIHKSAFDDCRNLHTISIPASLTKIGERAFYNCKKITSLNLPNSITSIGNEAFALCSSLETCNLPSGIKVISDDLFKGCSSLTSSIEIPGNVTEIGRRAFQNCSSIPSVSMSNNVKRIDNNAFDGCSSLASVSLSTQLQSINSNAFANCTGLTSISIPANVTLIGVGAFENCSSLSVVKVDMVTPVSITETTFTNRKNATLYVPSGSLDAYKAVDYWKEFKNIVTETDATDLSTATVELTYAENAFSFIGQQIKPTISSIKINGSVANTSEFIFTYGDNLNAGNGTIVVSGKDSGKYSGSTTVTFAIQARDISNVSVSSIPAQEYTGSPIQPSLTVTDGNPSLITTSDYSISYSNNTDPGEATITLTGKNNYTGTKNVTFDITENVIVIQQGDVVVNGVPETVIKGQDPDISKITVSYKGEYLVRNLDYEVSVDKSNKTITITFKGKYSGQLSFSYTEVSLNNIEFADATVKALCVQNWDSNNDGELSFDEAASVSNVYGVFSENAGIKSFDELQFFTGIKCIESSAFSGCTELRSIVMPANIEKIERFAFSYCTNLSSLSIPNNVTSIGEGAFQGCSSVSTILLGNSIASIGEDAFRECSSLTSVVLPEGITKIENRTFQDCANLSVLVIPNGVLSIGERACYYCKSLTSIKIPNSVQTIGNGAFDDCTGLKSVEIPEGVTTIGSRAFYHCTSMSTLILPNSLTGIGNNAFQYAGLSTITSHILNPFVIDGTVFSNYSTCKLIVPLGTIELYKSTAAWNRFNNISDGGSTGIEAIFDNTTTSDYMYYDAKGVTRQNIQRGLNIIKTKDGRTKKIMLK